MADKVAAGPKGPRPTKSALRKKPRAVLFAVWAKDNSNGVGDLDKIGMLEHSYEWFNNEDAMAEYYDSVKAYYESGIDQAAAGTDPENAQVFAMVAEINDTQADPMEVGRWDIVSRASEKSVADEYRDATNPLEFVIEPQQRKAAEKKPPSVKPKVKARKANAAAALVKIEPKQARPKPGVGKVRPRPRRNVEANSLKERLKGELVGMGAAPEAVDEALAPKQDIQPEPGMAKAESDNA